MPFTTVSNSLPNRFCLSDPILFIALNNGDLFITKDDPESTKIKIDDEKYIFAELKKTVLDTYVFKARPEMIIYPVCFETDGGDGG